MKKKLGIMLSTSVFTFTGFGMELQEDASSTKSSTVAIQSAMTEDMEDKSSEQMAELQKLLKAQTQVEHAEVDFVNSTIKYCNPCFPVSSKTMRSITFREMSFSPIININSNYNKLREEPISLILTEE